MERESDYRRLHPVSPITTEKKALKRSFSSSSISELPYQSTKRARRIEMSEVFGFGVMQRREQTRKLLIQTTTLHR
jgi:hypothetical protein